MDLDTDDLCKPCHLDTHLMKHILVDNWVDFQYNCHGSNRKLTRPQLDTLQNFHKVMGCKDLLFFVVLRFLVQSNNEQKGRQHIQSDSYKLESG
jgi:hypothetical protein